MVVVSHKSLSILYHQENNSVKVRVGLLLETLLTMRTSPTLLSFFPYLNLLCTPHQPPGTAGGGSIPHSEAKGREEDVPDSSAYDPRFDERRNKGRSFYFYFLVNKCKILTDFN